MLKSVKIWELKDIQKYHDTGLTFPIEMVNYKRSGVSAGILKV